MRNEDLMEPKSTTDRTSKVDWPWIAGFWEGEGSCGFYSSYSRGYKVGHLTAHIAQKDMTPLVYIQKAVSAGSVKRYQNKTGRWYYLWQLTARKAESFLRCLLPYIKTRRRRTQIINALEQDRLTINTKHHNYGK
jgi:hypothetical protein